MAHRLVSPCRPSARPCSSSRPHIGSNQAFSRESNVLYRMA